MTSKNKKGFSLVELIIVMAIMAVLGAVVAPQYASNKKEKSMSYARTQIINDIRYVQSYTLSTKRFPADGTSPTGGFGIFFEKGKTYYTVFGDKLHGGVVNHHYDAGYASTSSEYEFFEKINLVDGITITNLELVNSATSTSTFPTSVDYVSVPPYGKVYIGGLADTMILKVTFSNGVSSRTETININSSGFIS